MRNEDLLNSDLNFDPEYYVDNTPMAGHVEIGDNGHNTEIAGEVLTPWDAFMSEETRVGMNTEIGGNTEIGAEQAVQRVVLTARDNRTPAPPMRAVDLSAPTVYDPETWCMRDVILGAAATGLEGFPLLAELMARFGAGGEPRTVRVDTEASYRAFRADSSEEMAALRAEVAALDERLDRHEQDPYAHEVTATDFEDLSLLGAEVSAAESDKDLDVRLPASFGPPVRGADLLRQGRLPGNWATWREGNLICASIWLPGADGEVRICTGVESLRKCLDEVARYAALSGVPARSVVGVLPAMGCCLGAASVMKELAAAAPAILRRPEAPAPLPFVCRIEPQASPALCALSALAFACHKGDAQAQKEWQGLAAQSPVPVRQMMQEAVALLSRARA